jgi:2-oxoglutarate ferredoxin oxidoreductase subunit alpha
MSYRDFRYVTVRIGGEGGEGVISAGEILALAAAHAGLDVYTFRTYPAEIKGGHAMYQLRVGPDTILSQGDYLDVLVAMNREAFDRDHQDLDRYGFLLYDGKDGDKDLPPATPERIDYLVPMTELARKIGSPQSKNLIAVGATAALLNLPLEPIKEVVAHKFGRKGDKVVGKNLEALQVAIDYVRDNIKKRDIYKLTAQPSQRHKPVMSGNECLSVGALAAGCDFYAGYPITPASDIMEWLARELPLRKGVVVQTEDEIAALAMVLGASYAGKKAMTATSGPGFSLMAELIGLASMAEIPAVIADIQRSGPSTGMPTKTEQGDLYTALYASHGESPRIVIAPTTVRDCFFQAINAFKLAQKFQMPVILLSDTNLAHRKESIDKPAESEYETPSPNGFYAPQPGEHYQRYRITDTGVSPRTVPGIKHGRQMATGIEHTEDGLPNYEPPNRARMVRKRFEKLAAVEREFHEFDQFGHPQPDVGIVGWGSTQGVVRHAMARAADHGYRVAAFYPKLLNPLPSEALRTFVRSVRRIIVPEVNYQGQFANILAARFGVDPIRINRYDGRPLVPKQIYDTILEVSQL